MQASIVEDSRFQLNDDLADELARTYGTPLYVIDERSFRDRARRFAVNFPGDVSFASKANTSLGVIKMAHQEGCSIDVASEGEFRGALKAEVPPGDCRLHGNNKSAAELEFAVEKKIGKIIVDCFEEIEKLSKFEWTPPLLLRLAPGVDPHTHAKISTGQADTKFGFPIKDALRAIELCLNSRLPLIGFHCHVGSQLMDATSQSTAAKVLAQIAHKAQAELGFETKFLNIGGGLGVRYTAADNPISIEEFCHRVATTAREAIGPSASLGLEPGRSMVAEAGCTLYEVGVVKTAASGRKFVAVDGGLSDNPRPALYGARYELVWHGHSNEPSSIVTVSGKHCETDTLFAEVDAPSTVRAGDLVQVLCTGAYNASMANNYNGLRRPATVLVQENGGHLEIQRRETWDELHARDINLEAV